MKDKHARIKAIEDEISSLTANLKILEIEKEFSQCRDDISTTSIDTEMLATQSKILSLEDELSELYIAFREFEKAKQKRLTQQKLKNLQSFFDTYDIDFDVSLFLYLLKQTVRAIGVSKMPYHFSNYPFEEMTERYEAYRELPSGDKSVSLRQYEKVNLAFSRLTFTFYYLDAILGPTLHSLPILTRLFQLVKTDKLVPPEDIDAMNALMCVFCYKQTVLKHFIRKHRDFYQLDETIEMVRRYIGYRTELADTLNENRIKRHFDRYRHPTSFQLKQLHQLSKYAHQAQHEKLPFFFDSVTKNKKRHTMRVLSKLVDYYSDRRMILKEAELSVLLDKTSALHEILSQTFFSYPTAPLKTVSGFEKQYDPFPVPDDGDNPHHINFFP